MDYYHQLYNWFKNTFYPAYNTDMDSLQSSMNDLSNKLNTTNGFLQVISDNIFNILLVAVFALMFYVAWQAFRRGFYKA